MTKQKYETFEDLAAENKIEGVYDWIEGEIVVTDGCVYIYDSYGRFIHEEAWHKLDRKWPKADTTLCGECGEEFMRGKGSGRRSDAVYCGARCYNSANYKKKRLKNRRE